jgi:hypothetical protein
MRKVIIRIVITRWCRLQQTKVYNTDQGTILARLAVQSKYLDEGKKIFGASSLLLFSLSRSTNFPTFTFLNVTMQARQLCIETGTLSCHKCLILKKLNAFKRHNVNTYNDITYNNFTYNDTLRQLDL